MSERPPNRPRPIFAARQGEYDQPPATGAQRPWARRRRSRLHRFYDNEPAGTPNGEPVTRPQHGDTSTTSQLRRRQRSLSPDSSSQQDPSFSSDRRRGYDDFRQHLTKRRRIEPDVPSRPIIYGYYGQVEPGRLKMWLISCDGGQHTDYRCPHIDLGPRNVLSTDKSVYCSDRRSASILLRHADDTPFSLTQLMIVAPEHGFTCPVKEGLVYVSMTLAALTKYTEKADDAIQREPPPYTAEPDSITDHADSPDELALYSPPPPDRGSDNAEPQQPRLGQSHPNSYNTTSSELNELSEDNSSQEVLDFRMQRMQLLQRQRWRNRRLNRALPLVDDFSAFTDPPSQSASHAPEPRRPTRFQPADMLDLVSPSTASPACQPSDISEMEKEKLVKEGGLPSDDPAIHFASFYIGAEGDKVTINFRTPVSGRFILLNLRGAAHADNVDVQSIVATGFAGPRFFPARHPR